MNSTLKSTPLLFLVLLLLGIGCQEKGFENPFTDVLTLDCRNLLIRDVVLRDSIIEVTIENTCTTCERGSVYNHFVMLARSTTRRDTLAEVDCYYCLQAPANQQTATYQLKTSLSELPALETLRFDFDETCIDISIIN